MEIDSVKSRHAIHVAVQVAYGKEYLDFQMLEAFDIVDLQGNVLLGNVSPKRKWRVRRLNDVPPQYHYFLSLGLYDSEKEAYKRIKTLKIKDLPKDIRAIGGQITIDEKEIYNNTIFEIRLDGFNSIEEAEIFNAYHPYLNAELKSETIRDVRGKIEVCDDEYIQSAQVENGILIRPNNQNTKCRIYGLSTSRKHKRVLPTQTSYRGNVRFLLNSNGGIDAIHEMPIERYLQGVLAALGTQFHPDALKSFAIVARTWILSRIRQRHLQESYDFCFHSHCLPFCGSADFPKEVCDAADETIGKILQTNERLCPVSFTINCGGCTDSNHPMAGRNDDLNSKTRKFSNETDFGKWVKDSQDSYCNKHTAEHTSELNHLLTNFRWEVNYSKSDLEGILTVNLNTSIGHLYDINPGTRTKGGRLLTLEIIGSKRNMIIHGAEEIRALFYPKPLPSNAFTIEKIRDEEGVPIEYVFSGAGEGNGIGICIAGANQMALNKIKYPEIIKHYFPKSAIVKLY